MVQNAEKIGDNYQITIPVTIAEQCGIKSAKDIDIKVHNNSIVIETANHSLAASIIYWNKSTNRSEMYLG